MGDWEDSVKCFGVLQSATSTCAVLLCSQHCPEHHSYFYFLYIFFAPCSSGKVEMEEPVCVYSLVSVAEVQIEFFSGFNAFQRLLLVDFQGDSVLQWKTSLCKINSEQCETFFRLLSNSV